MLIRDLVKCLPQSQGLLGERLKGPPLNRPVGGCLYIELQLLDALVFSTPAREHTLEPLLHRNL